VRIAGRGGLGMRPAKPYNCGAILVTIVKAKICSFFFAVYSSLTDTAGTMKFPFAFGHACKYSNYRATCIFLPDMSYKVFGGG